MAEDQRRSEKLAAGGVIVRKEANDAAAVLIVHRPRYDDWSLPKGGVHSGETVETAALREVLEETGLRCVIERKLGVVHYDIRTRRGEIRPKHVHYFLMRPVSGSVSVCGDEVDRAVWIDFAGALQALHYDTDRSVLKSLINHGGDHAGGNDE